MYPLSPRAQGSGTHIRQIPHAHVTTITWTNFEDFAKYIDTV